MSPHAGDGVIWANKLIWTGPELMRSVLLIKYGAVPLNSREQLMNSTS